MGDWCRRRCHLRLERFRKIPEGESFLAWDHVLTSHPKRLDTGLHSVVSADIRPYKELFQYTS